MGMGKEHIGELEELAILKLNVQLYPDNWKVYDVYGSALLEVNNKQKAGQMFEKSLQLNPDNESLRFKFEEIRIYIV